jgi:hypothetical protein
MRYYLVFERAETTRTTASTWFNVSDDQIPEYMASTQRDEKTEAHALLACVLHS